MTDSQNPPPSPVIVGAAVIQYRGQYLLTKRIETKGNGGMWEFPGGKLHPGESLQECVEREIAEELGVKATAGKLLASAETYDEGRILRLFALETVIDREPTELKDHSEFKWVDWADLSKYPMTPAEFGLLSQLQQSARSHDREVTSLGVWSTAKLCGVLFAVLGLFGAMFLLVTSMIIPSPFTTSQKMFYAALIPVSNILTGAILGGFMAVSYNIFAAVFGGIKLKVD